MSFVCRVCHAPNAFVLYPRAEALLSNGLRADLRREVRPMHGEDQLLGFRSKGAGFGVSRGVFRVLHVRPAIAAWRPVFPPPGATDLPKGLRARVVPEQSSRLVPNCCVPSSTAISVLYFRFAESLLRVFRFVLHFWISWRAINTLVWPFLFFDVWPLALATDCGP